MPVPATDFSFAPPAFFSACGSAAAVAEPQAGESHALLLALSNIMTDAILIKGSDGRIVFANPAALRLYGISADTIIGLASHDLYSSSRDAGRIDANDRTVMASRISATVEETMDFPEGARTFETIRIPWLGRQEEVLGVISISTDITEHVHLEARSRIRQTRPEEPADAETADMRALIGHLERNWEEEKSVVARQMHDEFGSGLFALNMRLALLSRQLPDDPDFDESSKRIRSLLDSVAQAARRIHAGLGSAAPEVFGIRVAFEEQAAEFERHTGIRCRIDIPDDDSSYPAHIGIALYCMAQEALNRIAMHGAASHVDVVLDDTGDSIVLRIRETGCGMHGRIPPRRMTIGMRRMRERIACLGGVVKVIGMRSTASELVAALPKQTGNRSRLCSSRLKHTRR